MRSVPRGELLNDPSSSSVSSRLSRTILQRSKYVLPGSVRLNVRLLRLRSRSPKRCSTCITCLLTIAVEMSRRSLAATKLPDSTTCRNTRMLVNVSIARVYRPVTHASLSRMVGTAAHERGRRASPPTESSEPPSGVLLRLPPCGPQHERSLAVRLHLDYARVPEDRDLFPQNLFALLQQEAATVDREPGDVMSIGRSVAELLLVLEAHVKEVEFCRSATNAAARRAEP